MKQFYETYKDADEKLSPLVRQISWTNNLTIKSRSLPKAFTEKGLYMLATILKSQRAKRNREPSPDPGEKQSLSEERHLTRRECKINFGLDIALL